MLAEFVRAYKSEVAVAVANIVLALAAADIDTFPPLHSLKRLAVLHTRSLDWQHRKRLGIFALEAAVERPMLAPSFEEQLAEPSC